MTTEPYINYLTTIILFYSPFKRESERGWLIWRFHLNILLEVLNPEN